jgi:two-component system nitrate/nitrite response regulator NarL
MNTASNPIQILIADPQPSFRHGLRRLLTSTPGLCVVGEASDGNAVLSMTRQLKPQVLMLDARLALRSELAQLKSVIDPSTPLQILVMLQSMERSQVVDALRLGAHGIVVKTAAPTLLLDSIRTVAAGDYFLGSEVITILVRVLRDFLADHNVATPLKNYSLTHRELEIIAKIAAGLSNKEVAQDFCISERTVKHHLTNIFSKIGVSNRLALALFAVNHQLMRTPEQPTAPYANGRAVWAAPIPSVSS